VSVAIIRLTDVTWLDQETARALGVLRSDLALGGKNGQAGRDLGSLDAILKYAGLEYVPASLSAIRNKLVADGLLEIGWAGIDATPYTVSSLADSGPGTLREVLETEGPRVVTFSVSGTIDLVSQIAVSSPYLMVLGDTGPAGGICIRGGYIRIETHDVIFQHLRMRPGANGETDALQINAPAHHLLIDHCSLSWAVDENLDLYGDIHDVQVRYCIISEGLNDSTHSKGPHSMGCLVGGGADRVLIEKCLFAHNGQRNPLLSSGRADIVNCVMYNGGIAFHASGPAGGETQVNFLGNYQKYPPETEEKLRNYLWWYEDGTIMVHEAGTVIEEYDGPPLRLLYGYPGTIEEHLAASPFPPLYDGPILDAQTARDDVLTNAGATLPARDAVDARIVSDVQNGTGGLIDDPADVGGWPDLTL